MRRSAPPPTPKKGIPVALPARDAVLAGFQHRFIEAQYVWTSFLLDHLIECRRRLGDLDSMMVLIVLGLATLRHVQKIRDLDGEHVALGDGTAAVPVEGETVNAYSIASITGIPRENVRRRLADLAREGWVEQAPDGAWRLRQSESGRSQAGVDLADLKDTTIARIADLVGRLATVSAAAAADVGADGKASATWPPMPST